MLHLLFYISLQCCKIFQFNNKMLWIFVGADKCCMVFFTLVCNVAKSASLIKIKCSGYMTTSLLSIGNIRCVVDILNLIW